MQPTKSYLAKNWRVIHFLFKLSPMYMLSYLLFFLLKSLFPYIAIYGSALIIDALVSGKDAPSILSIVYWMAGVGLLVGIAIGFFTYFLAAWDSKIQEEVNRRTSQKTHEISYAQLEDIKTLRLIQAADEGSNGSGGIASYPTTLGMIIQGLSNLVYSTLLLRGLFVSGTPNKVDGWSTFLNNPWSCLIVFGTVLVVLAISLVLLSYANKLSYKAMTDNVEGNRHFGYFYDLCSDYTYGKDIRLFRMQKMIISLQKDNKYGVNLIWDKFYKADVKIQCLLTFFYALISFASYGYLGLKALYGLYSVGSAVAYAGAVALLSSGLTSILSGCVEAGLQADYLQNYFVYLALPSSLVCGQEKLDSEAPLSLEFSHVSFAYPNQSEKALDDVSLLIKPGEKLAIVGPNGAGKTTLMKLVCRLYEPDKGTIYVNGKPLPSYDRESLDKLYAIVFQDFKLFSFSIKDNIACGENGDAEKVISSLKKANIAERVLSFPKGIDTILYNKNDENGVEISGGEAQKIAIARALYKDAPLVILDEPTSALDPKSEAEVYTNFATLVEKKTSVFISHRMSSTKFCDKIAVISHGKLAEYGSHSELMALPQGLYKAMWDAQAQYYR
jgi:ATP-binding cassette, subfamily B, bacterial